MPFNKAGMPFTKLPSWGSLLLLILKFQPKIYYEMASEHKEQKRITDRYADGAVTAAGVFSGITYLLIISPANKNCSNAKNYF